MEKVAVIGLGLIGGSLALDIKEAFGCSLLGVDGNAANAQRALELGIVDQITTLESLTNVGTSARYYFRRNLGI